METIRVLESSLSPAGKGTLPARIVMMKKTKPIWKDQPFSTHLEVIREKGVASLSGGNYDMTLAEATVDFEKRCRREGISVPKALGDISGACKISRR